MSDKNPAAAVAAGRAPTADQPGKIRNVVLVGHSGAGKTTLTEALLVATGTIPRAGRVEDGTTVTDFDDAEVRQQRSVGLALAPISHDGVKVNLLDAPGYADFVGDLRAGPAGRRRRAVRRVGRRRHRRHHPDALGGVRDVGHAARRRDHPARLAARRLRGRRGGLPARPSAVACCRSTYRLFATSGVVAGLIGLLSRRGRRLHAADAASSATQRPLSTGGSRPARATR